MDNKPIKSTELTRIIARPVSTVSQRGSGLTEAQVNQIVIAGSKAVGDLGEIVKDVVAIFRIRNETAGAVECLDAQTRQIVVSAKAEIDRLVQSENHTRTRGQVVVDIVKMLPAALDAIPDVDSDSRRALIDSLRWLVEAATKD